jgi:pre-mRNA-processing factor 40
MAKPIGGDWVECFDENRSKYYYANIVTKATSWAFPQELLKDKSVVDRPDYWVEAVDAKSRKKYYYNKVTKETTWVKPECLKPRRSNAAFMNGMLHFISQRRQLI